MTAIAGIIDDRRGIVYIGADSAAVGGSTITQRATPKVFKNRFRGGASFIAGFTTSFRMGDLIRFNEFKATYSGEDPLEFLVTKFVPELRKLFSSNGWMKEDDKREKGGTFLMGFQGELFTIDSDFQVAANGERYGACGSGEDYTLGALWALERYEEDALTQLVIALHAAEQHNVNVRGPFNVLSLDKEGRINEFNYS